MGARSRGASPPAKALEEIGKVDILEREPAATPVRRGLEVLSGLESRSQLIVGRLLLGILERLVRLGDLLEALLRPGLLVHVRMVLLRELAIGLLDVLGARRALDAQDPVVVLVLHEFLWPPVYHRAM